MCGTLHTLLHPHLNLTTAVLLRAIQHPTSDSSPRFQRYMKRRAMAHTATERPDPFNTHEVKTYGSLKNALIGVRRVVRRCFERQKHSLWCRPRIHAALKLALVCHALPVFWWYNLRRPSRRSQHARDIVSKWTAPRLSISGIDETQVPLRKPPTPWAEKISRAKPPPADAEAYLAPKRRANKRFTADFFAWQARLISHGDLDDRGKNPVRVVCIVDGMTSHAAVL